MRRKDREVTDGQKIKEIIMACECCRLGFADGKGVYIVPLNFGYVEDGDKKIFYFHGAVEGRKIDLIKKVGYAGFELDTNHKLIEAETACGHSFSFQSVIGEGPVSMVTDMAEKKAALQTIMWHHSHKGDWTFPEAAVEKVAVFKLEVKEISCKVHL